MITVGISVFRLPFSKETLFDADLPGTLKFAKEKNIKLIELSTEYRNFRIELMTKKEIMNLKKLSKENEIEFGIHAPIAGISLDAPHILVRKAAIGAIKKAIDLAWTLGSYTVFHAGRYLEHPEVYISPSKKVNWQDIEAKTPDVLESPTILRVIESVRELYNYAKEKKVELFLENYDKNPRYQMIGTEAKVVKYIIEEVEGLRMCLDIGHANTVGDPVQYIEEIGIERIGMVHLSDNDGKEDRHIKLGMGNIDWKKVIGKLLKEGFKGRIVVEARDLETARYNINYLEANFPIMFYKNFLTIL